ncbi:uncharacterized protein Tco025E_06396 [Trypanosoma conorhini]|uniref:Uncharacterized protein n=1 Tax=Trypanosoma conorhini TaxID=83891 RepID=A0A3R7MXW6_9TRYP|nr:uncharacterized protein Tco025E_06396 [Trypanosoma conorhini]RNF12950.1 hypothetical protein Tco025E_06396 [Trypanosoma conorhini]
MEPNEGRLAFVPCVEDDWRGCRHGEQDANALALARRLAFLEGRVEEAYNLLEARLGRGSPSSGAWREWQEAALLLFSLCDDDDGAARWAATGLLPLPSSTAARTAVGKMDDVMYQHCIVCWVKLASAALLRRETSPAMSPKEATDTLTFALHNVCCVRLSASPRCLPTWRLLERVLRALLLLGAGSAEEAAVAVVRRMAQYLHHYLIRYLELRDRPMEGRCGVLGYRGVFDRASAGMNGGGGDMDRAREDAGEQRPAGVSARELCAALLTLCGRGGARGGDAPLKDDHPNDAAAEGRGRQGEEDIAGDAEAAALEAFLDRYFLRSAPAAFEPPRSSAA